MTSSRWSEGCLKILHHATLIMYTTVKWTKNDKKNKTTTKQSSSGTMFAPGRPVQVLLHYSSSFQIAVGASKKNRSFEVLGVVGHLCGCLNLPWPSFFSHKWPSLALDWLHWLFKHHTFVFKGPQAGKGLPFLQSDLEEPTCRVLSKLTWPFCRFSHSFGRPETHISQLCKVHVHHLLHEPPRKKTGRTPVTVTV